MKKYKHTLNLPKTDFPIKAKPEREVKLLKKWEDEKLYDKIQSKGGGNKFTLHDGPPYANGNLHHGHILNKVLKDIVVKYHNMAGYKAEFVPGWDCHGLPIETAVDKKLGPKRHQMPTNELRKAYREYASKFVDVQREEFKRLGILADWGNPYQTMDYQYEAQTLRELASFVDAGLLYRGLKPVFWCPTHCTALANNDIEYKKDHVSTAVFVLMPMGYGHNEYLAVWTTTPWTLAVNKAVAVNKDAWYVLLNVGDKEVWVAEDLAEPLINKFGWENVRVVSKHPGHSFTTEPYTNPLSNERCPIVVSDHVTTDSGTGFVHIAPAHGEDDFRVGQKYGLSIDSAIGDNGKDIKGRRVDELAQYVIDRYTDQGLLLYNEPYQHSYPYSSRSHKPVVMKATEQWFIDIDKSYANGPSLRERAIRSLDEVKWLPEHGYKRIRGMLETRPDWCISRQRTWGVPIPALKCSSCTHYEISGEKIRAVANIVEQEGLDFWFASGKSENKCDKCGNDMVTESSILDVWFDSGTSNAAVMNGKQVDLYLEGSDQHRGWFQSTLFATLGARELIPYKSVLTHGFVVDDRGEKLSKSKKNYVDPFKYIKREGAELLRLWVASSEYRNDVRVSQQILDGVKQTHHKIRNTIRYMIANLHDYNQEDVSLNDLDFYMLMLWSDTYDECIKAYESYSFHKVVRLVESFCIDHLSTFYLDVIKDSMYCDSKDNGDRRSTQAVLHNIATDMIQLMAPIMSFSMEDAWKAHHYESTSVHESVFRPGYSLLKKSPRFDKGLVDRYNKLRDIKYQVNVELERLRESEEIGAGTDANVTLYAPLDMLNYTWGHRLLAKLFGVSNVEIKPGADIKVEAHKAEGDQCQRCWQYIPLVNDVCERCDEVLKGLS